MIFQAAAALLFSQLLYNGEAVDVAAEQLLSAAHSEFTDLAQVSGIGHFIKVRL